MKLFIFFVLLFYYFFGLQSSIFSQEKNAIIDLLNNKYFWFTTKYRELKNNKLNFYESVDVRYPIFTDLTDTIVQAKLNKRLSYLLINQVETDSFKIKLFTSLSQSLTTYFSINNKEKDQLGIYMDNKFKFTPNITSIDFSFSPCYKSVVAFTVIFKYRTEYQRFISTENFYYYQIYYFNLENGKEYHPEDVFKKHSEKNINEIIEKAVKKNAENFDFKNHDSFDETDDVNIDSLSLSEKKLTGFSVNKDGFLYLKAFSFAYFIPAWSQCSINLDGNNVEVRLTFDEIKMYLNPQGPYGSLITYTLNSTTNHKNINNPLYCDQNSSRTPQTEGYESIPYFSKNKLKTITLKRIIKSKNSSDDIEKKEVLFKVNEFSESGIIKEIQNYTYEGMLFNKEAFIFNSQNLLIKKTQYENGKIRKTTDFSYDSGGNLLTQNTINSDDLINNKFYYYSNDMILEESYKYFWHNDDNNNTYLKKSINNTGLIINTLYFETEYSHPSENTFKYDKNNHILLTYNKKNLPLSGQVYTYDKNGNLLTYEFDGGRYLYEFKYDERNNMIQETRFDNMNVSLTKKIQFDSENKPISIEVIDNNSELIFVVKYDYN